MASLRTPLQGYEVIELLHSSSRTLVYRGLRLADNNTVIIKLLNCEYPTFSELVNFRNQYTIAKNLDLPGIVKPLALEHSGKGLALVMEDFGGIALSEYMAEHPLNLEEFFQVALSLCEILD
ncbi:protein kinase, partial [Roseofilum reptotaenium AO1-A]